MVKVLREETHILISLLNYEQKRHKSAYVLSGVRTLTVGLLSIQTSIYF